jgi:DNA-binding NarL/FixJ family response regulator
MATKTSTPAQNASHRIFLVENHPIVRQGLTQLINQEGDLEICGEAETPKQALEVVDALHPDLAIVDLALKSSSGLDLIKAFRAQMPSMSVLVLSMYNEDLYAERALRAGALGYVMKQEATETLLEAIRCVLQGEVYVSQRLARRIVQNLVTAASGTGTNRLKRLSDRELEVLRFVGEGYTTRQIAEALHLSIKTVETHRAHLMDKLQLANATELMRYAMSWVNNPEGE